MKISQSISASPESMVDVSGSDASKSPVALWATCLCCFQSFWGNNTPDYYVSQKTNRRLPFCLEVVSSDSVMEQKHWECTG